MDTLSSRIQEIQNYILFLEGTEGKAANMPVLKEVSDFKDRVKRTEYWRYIHSADYHYFVSRILFLRMIYTYSYFSGFQCIENYLKAFLKYCGVAVPTKHPLGDLLDLCRGVVQPKPDFIHSRYIEVITRRFEPYYQIGRYPVQTIRPKSGTQSFLYPDDIFVLDYFVYQMRRILTIPQNTWDMFRQGKGAGLMELVSCMREFPDFYNLVKWNNINFPDLQEQGESQQVSLVLR